MEVAGVGLQGAEQTEAVVAAGDEALVVSCGLQDGERLLQPMGGLSLHQMHFLSQLAMPQDQHADKSHLSQSHRHLHGRNFSAFAGGAIRRCLSPLHLAPLARHLSQIRYPHSQNARAHRTQDPNARHDIAQRAYPTGRTKERSLLGHEKRYPEGHKRLA